MTDEETPSLVTNGFSGKSKFNKFLLLLLLVFFSNRFKLKSEVNKNVINRNINLWKKKVTTKDIKVGRTPIWGYPEFMKLSGISGSLKNFLCVWICRLRYLLISINGHSYFSVALFELFFRKTATTNLIRIFNTV